MTPERLVLEAPAKINLALRVGERRPDGYHEVETLMLALDLCDRLEVGRTPIDGEVRIAVGGPHAEGVPSDAGNLAVRAAQLALSGRTGGLELVLEKHVPAAAGLGGGSSDAAAALLGSARALGLDPDERGLAAGLAALGSDCAFFRVARATGFARCTGRGERVEPLDTPPFPWSVALVTPSFGCRTAEVYRAHRADAAGAGATRAALDPAPFFEGDLARARAALLNELEPAALRASAELRTLRELLDTVEPRAFRLAGSGSSFFALCAGAEDAQRTLERVRAAAEARRCALRGSWVLRAHARRPRAKPWSSQFGAPAPG